MDALYNDTRELHVWLSGADCAPDGERYGVSIPLHKALDMGLFDEIAARIKLPQSSILDQGSGAIIIFDKHVCVYLNAILKLVLEYSQLRTNENFVNIDLCGLRLQPSNFIYSWCQPRVIGFPFYFHLQLKLTEKVVISEILHFLGSILLFSEQVDV